MKKLLCIVCFAIVFCSCTSKQGANNADVTDSRGKLYLRTLMWTGSYGSSLDISWLYLSDDGNIVVNPKYGVNPVYMNAEKLNNETAGRYKIEGDELKVTWLNGKTEDWKLERSNGDYSAINGGLVSQPQALPANYKLTGKFSAGGVLPNVSASSILVFNGDGKFTVSNLGTVSTAETGGSSASQHNGTYKINGNTLSLTFADGKTEVSPICQWDIGGKRHLIIGTSSYPEEK
jgi:hypothetical protein